MIRVFPIRGNKRDNICSTTVKKISAKALYKINIGSTMPSTVSWSKLPFFKGYLLQVLVIWKWSLDFPDGFKKCHSWKILCPLEVDALLRTRLWVTAMGYNLFIPCSPSHTDTTITTQHTNSWKSFWPHLSYVLHETCLSWVGLKPLLLFFFCSCTGELTDCSKRNWVWRMCTCSCR